MSNVSGAVIAFCASVTGSVAVTATSKPSSFLIRLATSGVGNSTPSEITRSVPVNLPAFDVAAAADPASPPSPPQPLRRHRRA